jgi:hypothetical protein
MPFRDGVFFLYIFTDDVVSCVRTGVLVLDSWKLIVVLLERKFF